jgi:hypothetical protein
MRVCQIEAVPTTSRAEHFREAMSGPLQGLRAIEIGSVGRARSLG